MYRFDNVYGKVYDSENVLKKDLDNLINCRNKYQCNNN